MIETYIKGSLKNGFEPEKSGPEGKGPGYKAEMKLIQIVNMILAKPYADRSLIIVPLCNRHFQENL